MKTHQEERKGKKEEKESEEKGEEKGRKRRSCTSGLMFAPFRKYNGGSLR